MYASAGVKAFITPYATQRGFRSASCEIFITLDEVLKSMKGTRASVKNHCKEPKPWSVAYLCLSSGSTGSPKGVICTYEGLAAFQSQFGSEIARSAGDENFSGQPLTPKQGIRMRNPDIRVPRPHPFIIFRLQSIIPHQVLQQHPNHQIGHIFTHALSRPKPKPPIIVPQLRALVLPKPLRLIALRLGSPERIPHIQRIRVDDEVCSGGDDETVYQPVRWRRLRYRECGERLQTRRLEDAGREKRGRALHVCVCRLGSLG